MKFAYKLSLPVLLGCILALGTGCEEDPTDRLMGQIAQGNTVDVSNRIAGFNSALTGAGATLVATGTDLSQVKRVMVAGILARDVEATDTEVSFIVPETAPIGDQEVVFIFSGAERAYTSIEVAPLPVIRYFEPVAGGPGDQITVYGINLANVNAVGIEGTAATIVSVAADQVVFQVPAGATTGSISVASEAGSVSSVQDFISCEEDPTNPFCLTALNTNGGFESATLGVDGDGGSSGGNWYLASSGNLATYEFIEEGGMAGLGNVTMEVTINELGDNNWNIQIVNDGYDVPANSRFIWMGRVWSDADGRLIRVAGGVSSPGYQDMINTTDVVLEQGWNLFMINTQHDLSGDPPQLNTMFRGQVNLSFPENDGATFKFDDFRVVRTGDWVDCNANSNLFFELYPNVGECP